MPMIESVLAAVYLIATALMVISGVLVKLFYDRLRTKHHDIWVELGRPSLFLNASILTQMRVGGFLWRAQYEKLEDDILSSIARVSKVLALLTVVLISIGFVLLIRAF